MQFLSPKPCYCREVLSAPLLLCENMAAETGEASTTDAEAEMQEGSSDSMSELSSEYGNETPLRKRAKERNVALRLARHIVSRPRPARCDVECGKDIEGPNPASKHN